MALTVADPSGADWLAGVCQILLGSAITAGFLTPVAAALVGVVAAGWWTSILPVPHESLFPSKLFVSLMIVMAAVIVLLGPGAFSVDARLFGLREIIIPRSRSDEQHPS